MSKRAEYRPAVHQDATVPDFYIENDLDYTSPYPCQVCHKQFRSRYELANHPHPNARRNNR